MVCPERERRKIIGKDIAMIFQEPTSSLNPCFTIGYQLTETLRIHRRHGPASAAKRRAIELLAQVGIPAPESRLNSYPHQLSGGMNQRVMIAMAIACNPKLLIADEPTTALDVTIQAQILDLLLSLQRDRKMALILITHNMGVVADTAERVAVHVCRPDRRGARHARACSATRSIPIPRRSLAARPEASEGGAARHHSGRGAGPLRPSARLPVHSALHLCDRRARTRVRPIARLAGWPHPLPLSARRRTRDAASPPIACTAKGRER